MASQVLRIGYRPLRVGFLIRPESIADLLLSVRLNTVVWGGIYNPLIPVGDDPRLVDRLIAAFKVDVLHPIADSDRLNEVLRRYKHLAWPDALPGASGFFEQEAAALKLRVMDVLYWIERNRPEEDRSPYCFVRWSDNDPLAPLFACMFGQFPTRELGLPFDYQSAFIRGLHAQDVPILEGQSVHNFLYHRIAPIGSTGTNLEPQDPLPLRDHGVFVAEPNFHNLVGYWNARASGDSCTFFPLAHETRLLPYAREYLRQLAGWVARQTGFRRSISIWREPDQAVPEEITGEVPDDVRVLINSLNQEPDYRLPLFCKEPHSVVASLDTSAEGSPSFAISLPNEVKLEDMPYESRAQQWVVTVSPLAEFREGHTLQLPFIPRLNEWYSHRTGSIPHRLRVQTGGIGVVKELWDQTLQLWPIGGGAVIYKILELAGFRVAPSVPGRIAQQLITQMGGLEGCRVFKIPGVRKLIALKSAREGITRSTAVHTIFDKTETGASSFAKFKSLVIASRETSGTPDLTFNYLLRQGVFRPGLKFDCPRCTLDSWVSLGEVSETCNCGYCGQKFLVAPHLKNRGDWRFRLTGLFGREGGHEGAVPVVLTLLQLLRVHGFEGSFLYSTGTELKAGDDQCEVDAIVVERSRGEVRLLLGECKTSGEVTNDDITKLLRVQRRVSKIGIECYPLFAKTTEHFTDIEIERLKGLRREHVWPILFTAAELEPYEPYENLRETGAELRHPHDLRDLARNSELLYLTP